MTGNLKAAIPTDFPSFGAPWIMTGPGAAVRPLEDLRSDAADRQRGDLQRAGRAGAAVHGRRQARDLFPGLDPLARRGAQHHGAELQRLARLRPDGLPQGGAGRRRSRRLRGRGAPGIAEARAGFWLLAVTARERCGGAAEGCRRPSPRWPRLPPPRPPTARGNQGQKAASEAQKSRRQGHKNGRQAQGAAKSKAKPKVAPARRRAGRRQRRSPVLPQGRTARGQAATKASTDLAANSGYPNLY